MQITFTKTGKKANRVEAVRRDGSRVSFPWPDTGASLPHDLVHCVVEQALGLRGGFWGLIEDGVDLAQVKDAAVNAARGLMADLGRDFTDLARAEAAVNYFTSSMYVAEVDGEMREQLLRASFGGFHVDPPAGFDRATELRVRTELEGWLARWLALAPGESLAISFDVPAGRSR